jgi:phospholipase C
VVYDHVIWIWMENKTSTNVIGNADAPYETSLAHQCAAATHYSSVGSPSLPNYIGATSGATQGITDDGAPAAHPITADNLFRQVREHGGTARSYEESMVGNCALESSGRYAVKHNPAAYYVGPSDRSACQADDVPLGGVDDGALRHDLDANTLPTFSFVTPDLCNDTHDCSVQTGDRWLQQWVPELQSSSSYAAGRTAIFVVWDEDSPMPFIAIAPTLATGTTLDAAIDHYALLRTTEEMLGLPTTLGAAAGAPSMRAALHL